MLTRRLQEKHKRAGHGKNNQFSIKTSDLPVFDEN